MKAIYRHKKSGDIFAIETDGAGVLFLRTTSFRRLVRSFKDEKFMTFQVTKEGLSFGNVLLPFQGSDMVYFANPEDAPERWPVEPPEDEKGPEKQERTLFD